MPLPAQCCRSEQAIVKMAPASDLSLRGGQRPTWQSRSTRPNCGKATGETATAFPRLPRRFAPRNDTSGAREVHQCPPAVELLPTGRSLSAATGPVGAVTILTAACANRLCSTGPGCPLPYKARPEACLLFILHFSVFIFQSSVFIFLHMPPLQRRVHVSPETKSPPGFPEGIAFYRGMAGTASISCRRLESEMSFRGHTAAQRPQETHLE